MAVGEHPIERSDGGAGGSSGSTAHGIGPGSDTFTVRIGQDNYFIQFGLRHLGRW
jgi:hypothetical protein